MGVALIGFPSTFVVGSSTEAHYLSRNGLLSGVTLCEDSRSRSPKAAEMMCEHEPFCYIAGGINALQEEDLRILSAFPVIYLMSPERSKHPMVQKIKEVANLQPDTAFWSLLASYEAKQ